MFALGGTWAGCFAGTVLLAEASSGGLFLHNTVSSNVLPFRLQTMISHVTLYLPMSLPLLALAVLGLFGTVRRGSALGPMRLYLLLAAATGLVTISRAGSYYNHLLETTAVLAVFGGIGFDRCLSVLKRLTAPADMVPRPGPERWLATAALAVAVGGFGLPLLAIAVKAGDPPDRTSLIAALRAANGPVLTEKDALAVMLARKEPIGGDPLGVGLLARQGTWDPAPLNQMVDSQAFGLIALNNPADDGAAFDEFQWWPPGTRELIQQRYQLDRRQDGFYMYVPRTTEAGR